MSYWLEAASTAAYLINRLPSSTTEQMAPIQRMFGITPSYSHLRTFGCECYPLLPSTHRKKLTPTSSQCIFLEYSETMKGYRCMNLDKNTILTSRHVRFNVSIFPFKNRMSTGKVIDRSLPPSLLIPSSIIQAPKFTTPSNTAGSSSVDITSHEHSSSPALHFPEHISPQPIQPIDNLQPTHHMTTRKKIGSLKPINRLNLLHAEQTYIDPTTYSEASKKIEWRKAMAEEFFALQK